MELSSFSFFYQYSHDSLVDSYWDLVFTCGKKKKDKSTLCGRYSTDDVIKSLGLAPNSSSEIIQDKLSSYLGHLVVFHTFSFLDISKKKNNRISKEQKNG